MYVILNTCTVRYTHTLRYKHTYIYIYMCKCTCVFSSMYINLFRFCCCSASSPPGARTAPPRAKLRPPRAPPSPPPRPRSATRPPPPCTTREDPRRGDPRAGQSAGPAAPEWGPPREPRVQASRAPGCGEAGVAVPARRRAGRVLPYWVGPVTCRRCTAWRTRITPCSRSFSQPPLGRGRSVWPAAAAAADDRTRDRNSGHNAARSVALCQL